MWHIPFQAVGEVDGATRNRLLAKLDTVVAKLQTPPSSDTAAATDEMHDGSYDQQEQRDVG